MPHPLRKPQFVYFDLDDTILDHRKAEKKALSDVRSSFDAFSDIEGKTIEEVYHESNVELWRKYSLKEITKEQLRRLRFERLLESLSINSLDPDEIGAYYMAQYRHYWDYCAGAREGFFAIAERYPVGVLTNGFAKVQHAKLAQFSEMRDQLKACVISEEFGHMKPHPRLFEHASEMAQTPAEEIVYIGDSMHSDVEGGQNAGWTVIWYAPHETSPPQHIHHAQSWSEVTAMLLNNF